MREKILKAIPGYGHITISLIIVWNCLIYFLSKLINCDLPHHSMQLAIDTAIPFIPAFIIIYCLAYAHWGLGYVIAARESYEFCMRFTAANLLAKLLCGIIFVAFPTSMARPEISGTGLISLLCRFIYSADTPVNLFPSIHCLESWMCVRVCFKSEKTPLWLKIFSALFAIAVFASVVLVKQHVTLDILGGVLVFEIGLMLSDTIHLDRLLLKLIPKRNAK